MTCSVFFLFVCFSVTTFAIQVPSKKETDPFFRNDYTYSKASKTFYKEHREVLKWRDAVLACSLEGATLAVPASEDEMNVLLTFMGNSTSTVWIGLHDLYAELHYMTFQGLPATNAYMNHQNYHQGGAARDCVKMSRIGVYTDFNCEVVDRFICKAEPSSFAFNEECRTFDKDYKKYPLMADNCHKLHTNPKTWHDAFKTCAAEQAQLVVVNSAEEAKLCIDLFNQYPAKGTFNKKFIHIGLNDLIIPGEYITIDGKTPEEAGFNDWSPGQPDNYQNNERCGSLTMTKLLNDITCTVKLRFVCEKKINVQM